MGQLAIYPDTGLLKCEQVAGGNETAAGVDIAVAGCLATDGLYAVLMCDAAYIITETRPLSDFQMTALGGGITVVANPTDRTGEFYLIFWQDLT